MQYLTLKNFTFTKVTVLDVAPDLFTQLVFRT